MLPATIRFPANTIIANNTIEFSNLPIAVLHALAIYPLPAGLCPRTRYAVSLNLSRVCVFSLTGNRKMPDVNVFVMRGFQIILSFLRPADFQSTRLVCRGLSRGLLGEKKFKYFAQAIWTGLAAMRCISKHLTDMLIEGCVYSQGRN